MNAQFRLITTVLFLVFFSTSTFSQESTSNNTDSSNVISVKIEGMHCAGGCAMAVQRTLNNTDGVLAANVDFSSSIAMIEYNSSIDSDAIISVISEMKGGAYEVTLVSNTDPNNKVCSKGKKCCKVNGKINASCDQKSSGCCSTTNQKCSSSKKKK